VRTSCVGEALTVPILKASRASSQSALITEVLTRIVRDESHHAQIGWWFLDWADPDLSDADRVRLGHAASDAIRAFAPLFSGKCTPSSGYGVLDCATFDPLLLTAIDVRVRKPLAARGIELVL